MIHKHTIKVSIPSELGYEKVAIAVTAVITKKIGLSKAKTEDLKTAVGEACTNAIEHGNTFNAKSQVQVVLTFDQDSLSVRIIDDGHQPFSNTAPSRVNKTDFRGMGLFLMRKLMDKVEIKSLPGRNEVQMVSYLHSWDFLPNSPASVGHRGWQ